MKLLLGIDWKGNFEKIKSKSVLEIIKGSPRYLQVRPTFCNFAVSETTDSEILAISP